MNKIPSIKELRKICQASGPDFESQTYCGRLNRVFSIYLTRIFISLPFSPNQITILSMVFFTIGVFLYVFNLFWLNLLGLGLIIFCHILDGVDGELSRYQKKNNGLGGQYVEPIGHDFQYAIMFLPIAVGLSHIKDFPLILILASTATIGKLLFRLLQLRFFLLNPEKRKKTFSSQKFSPTIFHKTYYNLFTSTGLIAPLLLATLLNKLQYFIIFYGISFPLIFLILFIRQLIKIKI